MILFIIGGLIDMSLASSSMLFDNTNLSRMELILVKSLYLWYTLIYLEDTHKYTSGFAIKSSITSLK